MVSLSSDETVETEDKFALHIPLYDISQKVREANEELKKDVTPLREPKEIRVKFCTNLVHYEPDLDNLSDTTCDESTDGTDSVTGVLDKSNDGPSFGGLQPNLLKLQQKQEEVNVYSNADASLLNIDIHSYNHEISWNSSCNPGEEVFISRLENHGTANDIGDTCSLNKLRKVNKTSNEISLASFNEVLKDMGLNETYKTGAENERLFFNEGMVLHTSKNEDTLITKTTPEEERTDFVHSDNKVEEGNDRDEKCFLQQECTMDLPIPYNNCSSQGCMEMQFNGQNNESFMVKRSAKLFTKKESIDHDNQLPLSYSKYETKVSDLQKSHHKYLMHYKWNNARLPTYNGLYSEYGLTAEMLEERKRQSEIIRQNLKEKKKQESEIKEQKRRDNDESFKEWLKKKEAERRKMAETNKDFEFIYDRQEAENAFQLWLKRKSKELKLRKKLKDTEREYARKLAQRQAHEESQREFKRWLREKLKKSVPSKRKGNSFNNRHKSYKRNVMEKNIHMKNTCKIYLGH